MLRFISVLVCFLGWQSPLLAQRAPPPAALLPSQPAHPAPVEAPAGFDTPTLVLSPGSKSTSNGIGEPPGDGFAVDQRIYETAHDVNSGLGPVYNARACADCHQNPVSGGASQFTELRIGHRDANGDFVNPTVPIAGGAAQITGRSILNDRAVSPEAQEHVPVSENVRALRAALNTLGDGFVEAIDDGTLLAIAARQPEISGGRIHGEVIEVSLLEAPGETRVGRFGWKDQHSSLLSFPEDVPDELGLADIDHFAQFIRGTKVPPRDAALGSTATAAAGERLFTGIGCGTCHVPSITTARPGTVIDGGTFVVPEALGNKVIHPYSDFLLHDIETGDGIVQAGPQDTANKLRTAPLWGLRMRPRFMHDLRSLTLLDAITRHGGEAEHVREKFRDLSEADKRALLSFLESL